MNKIASVLPGFLGLFLASFCPATRVLAQIEKDSTLGAEFSDIKTDGNLIKITGGAERGTKLFHSFSKFSIGEGKEAYFINPGNINTIFSRVTGDNPSLILGKLGIRGGTNTNLFFMNPRGIVFGNGASLDIKGAFVATTANTIKLPDGTQFSTINPQGSPLLTIETSTPIGLELVGLEFVGGSPGTIINSGNLKTKGDRNNISLVGGTIVLGGALLYDEVLGFNVNAGRLWTKDGNGSISLVTVPSGANSIVELDSSGAFNNKTTHPLTQPQISSIGLSEVVNRANNAGANTGLSVNGNNVALTFDTGTSSPIKQGDIFIAGYYRSSSNYNEFQLLTGKSGSLALNASHNITFINSLVDDRNNNDFSDRLSLTAIGDINLITTDLIVNSSVNFGASNINLSSDSSIKTNNNGIINLQAGNINLDGKSYIVTNNNGTINLQADNIRLLDNSFVKLSSFEGQKRDRDGNIILNASTEILLKNKSKIFTENPGEQAGNITLISPRIILENGDIYSGALGTTDDNTIPGNINLVAKTIELKETSAISTHSISSENINTGNIRLEFNTLNLDNSSILTDRQNNDNSAFFQDNVASNEKLNIPGIFLKERENDADLNDNKIVLDNGSRIETNRTLNSGKGSDIHIETGVLEVKSGSVVSANDQGSIILDAERSVLINGLNSKISAQLNNIFDTDRVQSGNLTINTDTLRVENEGKISTGISSGAPSGDFTAGNLTINAKSVYLDGGEINANVSGRGNSGAIEIRARDVINLDRESKINSIVSLRGEGNPGKIFLETANLRLFSNSEISTKVEEKSIADRTSNIDIRVTNLGLDNSHITASTSGKGDAGNINITASDRVNLQDHSLISTAVNSGGLGKGGKINISARSLNVDSGSQITTTTEATENTDEKGNEINLDAGNITLEVADTISLDGEGSGLFANTAERSLGNGGSIIVDPAVFLIRNNAGIFVNSEGAGNAGNISVSTANLTLDNGIISAKTSSSDGGNIILNVPNLLLLRNRGQISATAGTVQSGGNGGVITINSGFVIANSLEDSDILANAFTGKGGRVDIRANGIFGFKIQDNFQFNLADESLENPTPGISEIAASSQFGSQGTIEINTLQIEPIAGLDTLPETTVNVQVSQGCYTTASRTKAAYFYLGRTGLPNNPDRLSAEEALPVWTLWNSLSQNTGSTTGRNSTEQRLASPAINTNQQALPCK